MLAKANTSNSNVIHTKVHTGRYIDSKKLSRTTQAGIRVISDMSTPRVIWYLLGRHKLGLYQLATFAMAGYIAWDKVLYLFF